MWYIFSFLCWKVYKIIVAIWQVYLYEQLSNFTFFPQPLPVPAARDYTAADFDGDGDVDMIISLRNSDSFLYFERRGDGMLKQLFSTDNPFDAVGKTTHSDVFFDANSVVPWPRATLGDWNGDGETDLIMVDESRVSLWINRALETFVEVSGSENPFGQLGFSLETAVSLVNVSGKLDVVVPRVFTQVGPALRNGSYGYFQHKLSGEIVEQHGVENPFDGVDFADFATALRSVGKSLVVDFDGDGDLDIISAELSLKRNEHGHLKDVTPIDRAYPFHGIDDNEHSRWSFVDWDLDGDLDFVQAFMPKQSVELRKWAVGVIMEMKKNETSQATINAWMQKVMGVRMRFYRQDRQGASGNVTFTELTGRANPFHNVGGLGLDFVCPAVVDLDQDGDWDLVLATKAGSFAHFKTWFQKLYWS